MSGPAPKPVIDRLFARVEVDAETGCWNWTGAVAANGYGRINVGTKAENLTRETHRVCYELHEGPVPVGLDLDHLCRNPPCCNPDHLEPVTRRENVGRGISPAARNMVKTHCIHGHEFTPENTKPAPGGGRWCRACGRRRQREYKARVRASRRRDGV